MYDPAALKPAERQFKRMAHLLECLQGADVFPLEALAICPLFLYTAEKTLRALAWNRERPDFRMRLPGYKEKPPPLPVAVADPESSVWLIASVEGADGGLLAVVCREFEQENALFVEYLAGLVDFSLTGIASGRLHGMVCRVDEAASRERRYVPVPGLSFRWEPGEIPNETVQRFGQDLGSNVDTALIQLDYASKARQVVVEETPPTMLRTPGTKHIPRASERVRTIVLDPDEVVHLRKHSSIPQGGHHASPIPHMRRAHKRTLRAERWKNKRGQTVEVDATLVRPGEAWSVGRTTYKIVDLSEGRGKKK